MVLLKRYRMPTSINAMEGDAKSACVSQIVANTFGPPVIGFKTVEGAPIHSGRSYPQIKWRPPSLEKITKSAVKLAARCAQPRKENQSLYVELVGRDAGISRKLAISGYL